MKKIILLTISLFFTNLSMADSDPVMIIRFNKDDVNYDRHLSKVVSRVIQTKQDAKFKIIAKVAGYDNNKQESEANIAKMQNKLINLGVKSDLVTSEYQDNKTLPYNEIHLLVE